ncbi:ferredoxin, 2Fe-2S [Rhizobiales bacterium GAS113]|nr:ferredoxin, 2Fe-2S [Rhizobiales bacterium GAS113]
MPKITYIQPTGSREDREVTIGLSVMQGAVGHNVEGILAECGGNAMCATCHVCVDPDHVERLAPMSADEDALLEGTASERHENSRLSCQIIVTAELDGLAVRLPDRQV